MDLSIVVHSARDDPSDVYILFVSPDKPTCTYMLENEYVILIYQFRINVDLV